MENALNTVWVDNGGVRTPSLSRANSNEETNNETQPVEEPSNEEQEYWHEVWNNPVQHFKHFQDVELHFDFDSSHIHFGIVQMIQNEINLIWNNEKIKMANPLKITGIVDKETVSAFLHLFDKPTCSYKQLYNYIDVNFPEAHFTQM